MTSSESSKSGAASSSKQQSNRLVTTALILPFLLFGLDKWHQSGHKISLDSLGMSTPVAPVHSSNVSSPMSPTFGQGNKFDIMAAKYADSCPEHKYETRLFSVDPLILYVENYVTKDEAAYLVDLAEPYYKRSALSGPQGKKYEKEIRKSVSAVLPQEDPVVECIRHRSREFQGFLPDDNMEDIQTVKYAVNDMFRPHFDWNQGMLNPRISTFFVYLACDEPEDPEGEKCEGGGTNFPSIAQWMFRGWCDSGFVDCGNPDGIVFEPVVGNALFWHNFYPNGTGTQGVYHAGMPVTKGRKVGLNIFSRKEAFDHEIFAVTNPNELSQSDRERCEGQDVCYVKAN